MSVQVRVATTVYRERAPVVGCLAEYEITSRMVQSSVCAGVDCEEGMTDTLKVFWL